MSRRVTQWQRLRELRDCFVDRTNCHRLADIALRLFTPTAKQFMFISLTAFIAVTVPGEMMSGQRSVHTFLAPQ